MDNMDFNDALKRMLIELKEITLRNLINNDLNYQKACEKQDTTEKDYLNMELLKEQRNIIEELLLWTDVSNAEYSSLSYLAGIYDGCKLFRIFHHGYKEE